MSVEFVNNQIFEIKSKLGTKEVRKIEEELSENNKTKGKDNYDFWKLYSYKKQKDIKILILSYFILLIIAIAFVIHYSEKTTIWTKTYLKTETLVDSVNVNLRNVTNLSSYQIQITSTYTNNQDTISTLDKIVNESATSKQNKINETKLINIEKNNKIIISDLTYLLFFIMSVVFFISAYIYQNKYRVSKRTKLILKAYFKYDELVENNNL